MESAATKKVCIYCEKWMRGGIESFLAEILTHMDYRHLELHLAVAEKKPDVFQTALDAAGVTVHILQDHMDSGAFGRTVFSMSPFWSLLKREHFDVVHLNLFHGAALSLAFLACKAGVPTVIVHSHGAGIRKSCGYRFKLGLHYFCCLLFSIVPAIRWAASEAAGRFLFPLARQITVIPNGIDTDKFLFSEISRRIARQKLGIHNPYIIGCVGRLENQKNQSFLLDIMVNCLKIRSDALLLLVGDGEDRDALKAKARQLGIREHVLFYGESDNIPELMCAMDIFAVPSISEGLSIVTLEAQASGLPVICSAGVPEEVRITNAVTFLPLQAGAAQWAEVMLSQPCLDRIHQNGIVRNSRFQITSSAKTIQEAYEGKVV